MYIPMHDPIGYMHNVYISQVKLLIHEAIERMLHVYIVHKCIYTAYSKPTLCDIIEDIRSCEGSYYLCIVSDSSFYLC